MKKLKFLPAILMLVLCVGILAIGIYAITPSTNTIDGSITIKASNNQVAIVGYIDDVEVFRADSVRSGYKFEIPAEKLKFITENANTASEVKDKYLKINIKNKSSKALGVYFYNGVELPEDGYATEDHVTVYEEAKDSSGNLVAKVFMDSYSYLPANDDEGTDTEYDSIDMYAVIRINELKTDEQTAKINLLLNIEDYKATENLLSKIAPVTTSKEVGSPTVGGLVKFPDDGSITAISDLSFINNDNIDFVVMPDVITTWVKTYFMHRLFKEHACQERLLSLVL